MARTKEQRAYDAFKKASVGKLLLHRIENSRQGMADVIGSNRRGHSFWMENKALDNWPVRDSTPVLGSTFEPGQLPFLREWKSWGGNAYVLLRVGMEFFLIDPNYNLVEFNKDSIKNIASHVHGKAESIIKWLESREK